MAKSPRELIPHPSPCVVPSGPLTISRNKKNKSQRLTSLLGLEPDSHLQVVDITFSGLIQLPVTHLEVAREPGILEGSLGEGR